MSWFTRIAQGKPMALPVSLPEKEKIPYGAKYIDELMWEEAAEEEKKSNPQYSGAGERGLAIEYPGGHIGKVTDDLQERKAALYLMKNPSECTPEIYDVREIQPKLWIIDMEKVQTFDEASTERGIANMLDSYPDYERAKQAFPKEYDSFINQYAELKKCLRQAGLNCIDIHGGNIGIDKKGNLVLFDLGYCDLV